MEITLNYMFMSDFQDTSVKIKCEYLHDSSKKRLVYVNLPLSSEISFGFRQPTSTNVLNMKQLLKNEKELPKLLCVKTKCHCKDHHNTQTQSNVLMIMAAFNKKLFVRNTSTQKTYELSRHCDATFSTDPRVACASAKDLDMLQHDSLPWHNIEPTQPFYSSESPSKSLHKPLMTMLAFITEECFKIQTESGEFHLISVDNDLSVIVDNEKKIFPQSIYEEIDNIVNQPTRREYLQHELLPLSPSGSVGSFVSGASSAKTSVSSFEGSSFPIITKRKLLHIIQFCDREGLTPRFNLVVTLLTFIEVGM